MRGGVSGGRRLVADSREEAMERYRDAVEAMR